MPDTWEPCHTYRVRAFDPTATGDEEAELQLHQNVSFHKLGISHFNGNTQVFVDHRRVRHCTLKITFLKIHHSDQIFKI